ncbi:MAG TPA: helix-turn-helix domain-containing protein [Cyclobacteriaceae bacterium]
MTLPEFKRLVKKGENDKLEFKRKIAHPDKILREFIAFANTEGGQILVGVEDSGKIMGLKYPDEDNFLMKKAIDDLCRPVLDYQTDIIPLNESLSVIAYTIKPSKKKPHYIKINGGNSGKAYIRLHDKSVQASSEMKEILKRSMSTRGIKIRIGHHEKLLFSYLEQNKYITIKQYAELANIKKREASRKLILMVLAKVVKILPKENQDFYELVAHIE